MGRLGLIVCFIILAGCNQSDNSAGDQLRISSAMLPSAGNAKIDDGRVLQEPVLEESYESLEPATTATILDSITSKATSGIGVRLISLSASGVGLSGSGQSNTASLAELGYEIRAAKIPNMIWTEITIGDCDYSADCGKTIKPQ